MTFEIVRKIKTLRPGKTGVEKAMAPACLLMVMAMTSPLAAGPLGVDVGVNVGIGGGGLGVGVGVGVGVGGTSVGVGADVDAGAGGVGVGASVGVGGSTPGTPGTPGAPGVPGVVDPATPAVKVGAQGAKGMLCAKGGNATAYNGFVLRDRAGTAVGVVHEATVSAKKIVAVRMLSNGMSCYSLAGATFRVKNGEVWANVDAASFK